MKHLILYDGSCPLCNRAVRFILARDKQGHFLYAPLDGKTAKKYREELLLTSLDTMILVENFKTSSERLYIESRAVFKTLWLLGGIHRLPGLLSFLPSCLLDFAYRIIARRRYQLFSGPPPLDEGALQGKILP